MNTDKMYGYKVKLSQVCGHHEDDGEEYGHWFASYSNFIETTIQKVEEYPDVVSTHDIQEGETAYVVWAIWSSGDSFGHDSGGSAEAFGVFVSEDAANDFKEALRTTQRCSEGHWEDQFKFNHNCIDGQSITINWVPWFGYFESLDSVEVSKVTVEV